MIKRRIYKAYTNLDLYLVNCKFSQNLRSILAAKSHKKNKQNEKFIK